MNIVNLNPTVDFGLETSRVAFPVITRPLAALGSKGGQIAADSHKAVVRADAGGSNPRVVGVVGTDYKLLKHLDMFGNLENTLKTQVEPSLLKGAKVTTNSSYDGAWVQREYVLPAFAEALETSNGFQTTIGFRAIGWNSYDGSSSAGLACGLIDFYCSNGIITGSLVDLGRRRHTKNLEPDHFNKQLIHAIGTVQAEIRTLRKLANTKMGTDDAEDILMAHFSERRAKKLMERVEEEAHIRGWNVFALHSALTFYASHNSDEFGVRETGNDNVAATLHNREAEINRIMPHVLALAA